MKKKRGSKILILLIFILILIRLIGGIRFFNVPSSSNEPNLKVGSRFIGSSFVKPDYLDFAYFKFSDSLKGYTIIKRLIAKPLDTVECKNGVFYVNGSNLDKELDLRFHYRVSKEEYEKYILDKKNQVETYSYYYTDTIEVFMNRSLAQKLPVRFNRNIDNSDKEISIDIKSLDINATLNNFGPIIIPIDKYFFLGDSRDNSIDSRYRGFVDRKHILGTLVFKF